MKINLNKSTKRALSLVLALAMLAGSLFTANVGVNINASAENEGSTVPWNGEITEIADTESTGEIDDPIEIATPAELAWLACKVGAASEGLYYKIADGIAVFDFSGHTWSATNNSYAFAGFFDGNGVVMRNISGSHSVASALFACVNTNPTSTDGIVSFENIIIEDSSFTQPTHASYSNGAAAIVAWNSSNNGTNPGTIIFENCKVVDSTFKCEGSTDSSTVGIFCANATNANIKISNCFASGNTLTAFADAKTYGGFVGRMASGSLSVSNCISIGTTPVSGGSAVHANLTAASSFSNVYTDQAVDTDVYGSNNIKQLTVEQMTGEAAKQNMALDFSSAWLANTSGVPVLRVFHSLTATNNGDGTHSEVCDDCGLVGVPANHFYNEIDKVNNITKCSCGAYIKGIFDIWDSQGAIDSDFEGKGTEEEPYIINTVEELFGMVRSTGIDEDGNALHYKVADGVSALYINDTRTMTQDQFNSAAAGGTLNNWSTGLTKESAFCTDGGSCTASNGTTAGLHKDAYVDHFGGKFDGNGVTIYGLYSKSTATAYWANGAGFVPMLTGDATIKNVIFDTNYVIAPNGFAAVISASTGIWVDQYKVDTDGDSTYETYSLCPYVEEYVPTPGECNAVIMNVAVRNSHIETTENGLYKKTCAAGLVSSLLQPNSINILNSLFDGTNSTFVTNGTTNQDAGIYSNNQGYGTSTYVENCLVVNKSGVALDAVSAVRYPESTTDLTYNTYSYGISADNTTLGTLKADGYKTVDALPLLNWVAWDIDAVETYDTPMPKLYDGWEYKGFRYYKNEYKNSAWYDDLPYGHSGVSGAGYEQGIFSGYEELVGSGTEADPYIIDNAQLLFEIIASGGTHRGIPQYFKLACDIDLGGVQWVNYQTDADLNKNYGITYYQYKPFAGTIDGDGHTITGMFTATSDTYAGFIPELAATGVVKNLHFSNSYAYTSGGKYGIIAGSAAEGSEIIGCSIEGGVADKYIGTGTAAITDSYCGSDVTRTNETLFDGTNYDTAVWYKGESGVYRLFNKALAMPCADIDGDGNGYEYNTNDLTALKGKLLKKSEYANVYGDVSRNGVINIRDMAILQREVVGDEVHPLDGFWKNVKAGKFNISYGENDNYDAARKLQLYFEEVAGVTLENDVDIKSDNGDGLDIIIETVDCTDSSLGGNDYSVSYDIATAVLSIKGVNFTAVEQAVLNFIAKYDETTGIGSDMATGKIYEGVGSLSSEVDSNGNAYKQPITVTTYQTSNENGSLSNSSSTKVTDKYYYVWGDEFETDINGTVSYDNWLIRDKGGDDGTTSPDTNYINLKLANADDLPILNAVSGGKLTMHRGVSSYLAPKSGEASGTRDDNGNIVNFDGNDMSSSGVLTTRNSLLFKRGYLEMQATLPNDDYAFPAWWLLTNAGNNNLEISRSLYSKVYEENTGYDNNSLYFSSDDYTTYQYKLPTSTFEIDLFEIINNPNGSGTRNAIFYNLHKWYNYSETHHISGEDFKLYELDWAALEAGTITNFNKQTPLLEATYSNGAYSISNTTISYHTDNAAGGQINAAINEKSGTKYGTFDEEMFTGSGANNLWKTNYTVNMIAKISGTTVTEYKYGFLWTEDEMTYIIKGTDGSLISSVTVNCADLGYDGGSVIAEQYAYFLIDNHFYTNNGATISSDAPMTIDYVRLYQLDGERDIVTPETERDNVQSR